MPTVEPNASSRVLVTGGNGFIGMWVVRILLEQGYTVRGAIRSLDRGKRLREYFAHYGNKVEWIVVEDITKEGAFDDAVKDVNAIVHMASPVNVTSVEPDAFIKPAVNGTLSILNSAVKFGTKVKRIVFTSSCAAIVGIVNKPTVIFNEENWGDEFVKIVDEKGKEAPGLFKYRASKTLAEKTAWKVYNEHKAEIGWDLVALNPPLVVGPTLLDPKTPDDLNSSLATWWNIISKEASDDELKQSYAYIDVRDIATAHVVALSKEEASGQRIIVSNGAITWQETRNVINALQPKLYTSGILPRGNPDLNKAVLFDYDPSKGKRILGIKYRNKEEIFSDTLADFKARGWLEKPLR